MYVAQPHHLSFRPRPYGISWYLDWALWLKPFLLEKNFLDIDGHCHLLENSLKPEGGKIFSHSFWFYYYLHFCPLIFDSKGVLEIRESTLTDSVAYIIYLLVHSLV